MRRAEPGVRAPGRLLLLAALAPLAACGGEPAPAPPGGTPGLGDRPARAAGRAPRPDPSARSGGEVRSGFDARTELSRAARLRRAMWGREGAELDRARAEAVAAYRALRRRCVEHAAALGPPGAARGPTAAAAEAAFRAGELLRAGGDAAGAAAEFRRAVELGGGTEFRPRARLELGHLARRAERWDAALQAYEAVEVDVEAVSETRAEAALWRGRVELDRGRLAEARRVFRRVARSARDPLDRVRAYDSWAIGYVASGDLEAAAGVLAELAETLRPAASEATELGERVRSALEDCRARAVLRSAVERRRRAARAPVEGDDAAARDARR